MYICIRMYVHIMYTTQLHMYIKEREKKEDSKITREDLCTKSKTQNAETPYAFVYNQAMKNAFQRTLALTTLTLNPNSLPPQS